jgi:hypothetical protein
VNTPLRSVRIDDELWQRAGAKAEAFREPLSEVLRRALEEYAALGDGWDQIPVSNGPDDLGLEGCRIHHRAGCRGRADSPRVTGWHTRTGTAEELAQCSGRCDHCADRLAR